MAIVSDIHGNRTALEAVIADLRETAPDLVLHGGDLADGGSSSGVGRGPGARPGLAGHRRQYRRNAVRPGGFRRFRDAGSAIGGVWGVVRRDGGLAARQELGRSGWPGCADCRAGSDMEGLALVHAIAGEPVARAWSYCGRRGTRCRLPSAGQAAGGVRAHPPAVRAAVGRLEVANTGSAGLPYDDDPAPPTCWWTKAYPDAAGGVRYRRRVPGARRRRHAARRRGSGACCAPALFQMP